MAIFTVHVPPGIADPLRRADHTIFVRDGFSLPAFLFGPVYLLYRRLWVAAVGWIAAVILIGLVAHALDMSRFGASVLVFLVALLTGLEAHEARRGVLDRRGYIFATLLAGVSREEGERLFFGAGPPRMPVPRPVSGQPSGEPEVIGLFPSPGDLA